MIVYTAAHLLPVASPPVRDGAVAVEGDRIVAAGPRDTVLETAGPGAEVHDLGCAALLPGLVNAHCHVELSWMGQDPPPADDYVGWVRGLIERREAADPERCREAARAAVETMAARGTVAVGDIANEGWVAPILADSELCGVLFHEIYGPNGADAERLLAEAAERLDEIEAADGWQCVLTPHAPHTTSESLLRALAGRAAAAGQPLSIHVAESDAELAFVRDGSGPFAALFRDRGLATDEREPSRATPVELLDRLGVLGPGTLAVHCVHLTHADISKLQSRGTHVVTCPRSNARLGVGRAPVPQLLGQGIPVALGTDSLASAPDLDLLAEMAALLREHPKLAPAGVLRMATLNGAAVLGLDDRLGSIEPGKSARLLVVPLAGEDVDPLAAVCDEPAEVFLLDRAPCVEADR